MSKALSVLLEAYNLRPVSIGNRNEIDIHRLPAKYREAFACIFYPKTIIYQEDIDNLENFWKGRENRLQGYADLIRFYGDEEVTYDNITGTFSISVIISRFKPIQRLFGISTVDNRGNVRLRGIIIPERFVVDREIDDFIRSPVRLVNTLTDDMSVKLSEDSGIYMKTNKSFLLVLDVNELSNLLPLRMGSVLGKCDCIEDMIAIYIRGTYYIVLIEKNVWFEFQIKASDLSRLAPISHPLLRKLRNNFSGKDFKRIPLQFIMSNLSNCRSIDMLNYDVIADTALRQDYMSQCIEYCIGLVRQESSVVTQRHFNAVFNQCYPNVGAAVNTN